MSLDDKTQIRAIKSQLALKGLLGLHKDKIYPVSGDFSIGREQDNDLVINEGFVSRYHATMQWLGGELIITDKGSSNGTLVNGESVTSAALTAGDVLKFDIIEFSVIELSKVEGEMALPRAGKESEQESEQQFQQEPEEKLSKSQAQAHAAVTAERSTVELQADLIAKAKAEQEQAQGTEVQGAETQRKASQPEAIAPEKPVADEQVTVVASKADLQKADNSREAAEEKTVLAPPPKPVPAQEEERTVVSAPPSQPSEYDSNATDALSAEAVSAIKEAKLEAESAAKLKSKPTLKADLELLGAAEPVDGRSFKIKKELITIGRSPFNDIILRSDSVSSRHAEIERDGDVWMVRDLGSSNGTFVNDLAIEECDIYHNDSIIFGEVELIFDPHGLIPEPEGRVIESVGGLGINPKLLWAGLALAVVVVAAVVIVGA